MDELGSLWSHQVNLEELKHKLLCMAVELNTVKLEAKEHMRKTEEDVKSLLDLINMAQMERDEARDQLQKILTHELLNFPRLNPDNLLLFTATNNDANSSVPGSNSLGSSPVDSLFEASAVSLLDFSNFSVSNPAFAAEQFVQECSNPAALANESLAKKRALPQKGKLLQAVMEAGPLLMAGPLRHWHNPPPLQPFGILHSVYSQACSASLLNFCDGIGGVSGSNYSSGSNNTTMWAMSSDFGNQISMEKRQGPH